MFLEVDNLKFVFDLDGTICFRGQPLNSEICTALDRCAEEGHEVIFASARPIRDMLPVLPKRFHGFRMVGGNGAFIYEQNNIHVAHFEQFTLQSLVDLIEEYRLPYLADGRWDYSFTGPEDHPIFQKLDPLHSALNVPLTKLDGIVKIVIFSKSKEIEQRLRALSVMVHIHGDEGIFDISPAEIDKWSGLQKLGVLPRQFIAFGNDTNDLAMFEQAKESVCVGQHSLAMVLASHHTSEQEIVSVIEDMCSKYNR